jgi:serine/threonine protein kinase
LSTVGNDYAEYVHLLVGAAEWTVERDERSLWVTARPDGDDPLPAQGWKLHISAGVTTAGAVLQRLVPYLVAHRLAFKAAADPAMLQLLNLGEGGDDQIGKFVTIYPRTTEAAVSAAGDLDVLLDGLRGPEVPSDRRLRHDSVVSYRYGAFVGRVVQLPTGQLVAALEAPDGTLVPDSRHRDDAVPAWLDDPFEAAGLVTPPPPPPAIIGGRFRPIANLSARPGGRVDLALELRPTRRCVLKRAVIDANPLGPSARLAAERAVLAELDGLPGIVQAYDWMETDTEHVLVLEDLPGRTLADEILRRHQYGDEADLDWTIDSMRSVAEIVSTLHHRGYVHRDLKPTNLLVRPDGRFVLIDFELAVPTGAEAVAGGTPGYASPQQRNGAPADPRDDIHALGAMLFLSATGVDRASRPSASSTIDGMLQMAPQVPREFAAVLARCLADDPDDRYPSADALIAALAAVRGTANSVIPAYGTVPIPGDHQARAERNLAGFVDALRADAVDVSRDGEHACTWVIRQLVGPISAPRDLAVGVAGIVLALTAVARQQRDPDLTALVHAGARWLDQAPRPDGQLLGGLLVGEGGVALALARAGLLTGDGGLTTSARHRAAEIASLAHTAPDVFNGSAGRALVHLRLAEELDDGEARRDAMAAARFLLDTVTTDDEGRHGWILSAEMGTDPYLGYGHGAAGIADVLLEVGLASGTDSFVDLAATIGVELAGAAITSGDGVVGWPLRHGGTRMTGPAWCHGAGGVGRFLMHLDRAGLLAESHRHLVRDCAVAVVRHGRAMLPTACHGLAGSIDLLVDLHGTDGDAAHLTEAWSLAGLLETFHVSDGDRLRCSSDQLEVVSPDLWFGSAGVAMAWLRLANPEAPGVLDAWPPTM